MRRGKSKHCGSHDGGRNQQICFVTKMIHQRTNDQLDTEYSEIEQEKQVSLLSEIDMQTRAHCRQTENSSKNGENDAKHQNAGTCTKEQDSGARQLAPNYRFSKRS